MKIDLKWDKPVRLKDGSKLNQIYTIRGLERISNKAGVYIFARSFGRSIAPLYVGQASRLRKRIDNQFNNVHLMMGVKNAQAGGRILLVANLKLHPGQQEKKVLDIVESALIKHALAEGYDLLNKQGVKTPVHVIKSKGNTSSTWLRSECWSNASNSLLLGVHFPDARLTCRTSTFRTMPRTSG